MAPEEAHAVRRVAGLVAATLVLGLMLVIGLGVLDYDPEPVRVLLLTLVLGAVLTLLVEARAEAPEWETTYQRARLSAGRDARTSTYLRVIEGNRTARHGDPALQRRLDTLTAQVLHTRHGLSRDDAEARLLLQERAPRLLALLERDPRRVPAGELDACLSEIEAL